MAAPPGNNNAGKGRRWQDALNKALARYEKPEKQISAGQALDKLAEQVVQKALDGHWDAIQEIGNRLDGKPAQAIEHTGDLLHRHVTEVTDAELLDIATASSVGASETPSGTQIN